MTKAKANAKNPRVFVPLTKVDEEQRLVYGTITQEVLDKSNEMMDYDSSKPHFEKWSNDIHTASGGLSKGNLRVMHGLTVAGKVTELEFNDDDKSIEVCTKVVDDAEWNKVLEGCYTGFSVGGKYGKKWKETVDGAQIQKFEAIPNEVSLVDNPCVPSATFSLVKADGAEEQIMFKAAATEDQRDPGDEDPAESGETDESTPAPTVVDNPHPSSDATSGSPHPGSDVAKATPTNGEVAERATELAKEANDGTTWMQHVDAAREELTKAFADKEAKDDKDAEGKKKGKGKVDSDKGAAAADAKAGDDKEDGGDNKAAKVTPAGVTQKWTCSDGSAFEKKEDAVRHEESLEKKEPTEVEALAARLEKALSGEPEVEAPSILSLDRVEDLHKAVLELELPRGEDGAPLLEKGMYTVSRFANMLGDVAGLARTIKAEGKLEEDGDDESIAKTLQSQLGTFGDSFMTYAKQQIAELVAGLDADLSPRCAYDYYYRAAGEGNDLAKHVVELIESVEDEVETATEELGKLAKVFGYAEAELTDDDRLSPPMQKRFDALEAENTELKKVATDAVEKVEELAKRMQALEDTPMPRGPGHSTAFREGDGQFFGKAATTEEDKINILHDLVKTHGTDGVATMLIKAAQQNGQKLHLQQ